MTDEQIDALMDAAAGVVPALKGRYSSWERQIFRWGLRAGLREAARIADNVQLPREAGQAHLIYLAGMACEIAAAIRAAEQKGSNDGL